jgi:hypothetical protein
MGGDFSIFCGDLGADVDDSVLLVNRIGDGKNQTGIDTNRDLVYRQHFKVDIARFDQQK